MSTTEARSPAVGPARGGQRRRPTVASPGGRATPIVPTDTIAGRALVMVIAIMTFLAGLTVGAVDLVASAARAWERDVAREITIQVAEVDGADLAQRIARVVEIASAVPGVAAARPLSDTETARLLEPWLGPDAALEELPTPRLVILTLADGATPDLAALRQELAAQVPEASLDDHRAWIDRLQGMADLLVYGGLGILVLMTAATVLSVVFATRGAMAGNRDIIHVLNVVGARDGYVARAFERRFLALAARGGAIGGGTAIALFALASFLGGRGAGSVTGEQMTALVGRFGVGWTGYLGVVGIALATALITMLTTRATVIGQLRRGGD